MPDMVPINYLPLIILVVIAAIALVCLSVLEAKSRRRLLKKYSASAQQNIFNLSIRSLIGKEQAMSPNNITDELAAHFKGLATSYLVSENMDGGMDCSCVCLTSTQSQTVDDNCKFSGELTIVLKIFSIDEID